MKTPVAKKPTISAQELETTIRAYDRELYLFLVHQLRGRNESPEDVRQEIYLRMLRFTNAELVREPRAYLYRVARNVLHDKLSLARRELATFESSETEGVAPDETAQIDNARDLQRILSRLPPLYRAILQLRTIERLSYSEIAEELDISVHTVKKYMHLALVQCRAISLELT